MKAPVTIVGSGLAGYHAAKEFRKHDSEAPLLLLTADGGEFYSKPMLSNALSRQTAPEQLASAGFEQMAAQLNAEIRIRAPVTAIDPGARVVETAEGDCEYSRLVLAVGARQAPLDIAGDGAGDVVTINSLEDFTRFYRRLGGVRHVAIIGPGLIGTEFANDLCSTGRRVSVIGPDSAPLGRLLPPRAGNMLKNALEAAGVEWHLEVTSRSVSRHGSGYIVELSDGRNIEADIVMSAIGLRPDVALAERAAIDTRRGIVVDRYLAASAPDVYAIGDCAELEGLLLPFVMPIMFGARALGKTLAGNPTPVKYPVMPVVVKTPAHPVVVCPPAPGAAGEWEEEPAGDGIRALFRSPDGSLLGFALTGDAAAEKQRLVKEVPPLLN